MLAVTLGWAGALLPLTNVADSQQRFGLLLPAAKSDLGRGRENMPSTSSDPWSSVPGNEALNLKCAKS